MIGIYKITNNINGKIYIGQSRHIKSRWSDHKHCHKDTPLYNDMWEYGIENFSFDVLEECEIEELNEKEKYWVSFYDSHNNGYNLTPGGGGASIYRVDPRILYEKYQELQSVSATAEVCGCSMGTVRRAIQSAGIDLTHLAEEKQVLQIDPNTLEVVHIYDSLKAAGVAMGLSYSAISRVANHHGDNAGGYYWRFADDNDRNFGSKPLKRWKRKIAQCDLITGEILNSFESASAAARSLGKDSKSGGSSIIAACKGKYKHAFGYGWKYLD